MDANLKG